MKRIKFGILIVLCIALWNGQNIYVSKQEKKLMPSTSIGLAGKVSYHEDSFNTNRNDLVYRTYGNALSLNKGSTCYIYDLSIKEELDGEAYLTIVNVLTQKEKVI